MEGKITRLLRHNGVPYQGINVVMLWTPSVTKGYAREELAELGSAFLSVDLGITPEVRDDHAAYIERWLKAPRDEKHLVIAAAAHAQRAVDYLDALQPSRIKEARAAAWAPLPCPGA
jgi:antirestriction protein ArdC